MCIDPLIIKYKGAKLQLQGQSIPVPCSRCPQCAKARINSWLFRLTIHEQYNPNPLFITLTYDDTQLVYGNNGNTPSLHKTDVQLFLKRLRKAETKQYGRSNLSYYAVGEYGSRTHRPHYHLLVYNLNGTQLEQSNLIQKVWNKGFTLTKPLLEGGVRYTLKYISKPRTKYAGIEKEFSLMSKNIGVNYLTDAIIKYHLASVDHCHVTLKGGIKLPLPKYYKEKIYDFEMRWQVAKYLQAQSDMRAEAISRNLKSKLRHLPEEKRQQIIQRREKCITFDKRLTEMF